RAIMDFHRLRSKPVPGLLEKASTTPDRRLTRPPTLFAFLVLAAALGCSPSDAPAPRAEAVDGGALDSLVEARASLDGFSGVVEVEENGRILLRRAFGLADRGRGIANRPATKFVVASVTQTFTAVAAAQLIEQQRVSLDGTLSKYWPGFPDEACAKATVRQLLTHTAGIGGVVTSEAFRRRPGDFRGLHDYLR